MPARYRRRTLLNYLFARRANSFTPSFLHRSASTGSRSTAKVRSGRASRYRAPSPSSVSTSAPTPPRPRSRRARVPPLERRNTARFPDAPRHHRSQPPRPPSTSTLGRPSSSTRPASEISAPGSRPRPRARDSFVTVTTPRAQIGLITGERRWLNPPGDPGAGPASARFPKISSERDARARDRNKHPSSNPDPASQISFRSRSRRVRRRETPPTLTARGPRGRRRFSRPVSARRSRQRSGTASPSASSRNTRRTTSSAPRPSS